MTIGLSAAKNGHCSLGLAGNNSIMDPVLPGPNAIIISTKVMKTD